MPTPALNAVLFPARTGGTILYALNDFEFGVNDDLVTAAALTAAEQGTGWVWTQSRTPLGHTRITTSGNDNFTLLANVNGHSIATTGTRRINFNLTEAVSDGLTPVYEMITALPPTNNITRLVVTGFVTFGATAAGFVSMDIVWIGAGPYLTMQLNINGSGTEGSGGEVHIETQVDGGMTYKSTSIPVTLDTTYCYELCFDGNTGAMALILRSADQSTLIGTSGKISNDVTASTVTFAQLTDYLNPEAGYMYYDKFSRVWGTGTPFPLFPLTVPTPANITLEQLIVDQLVFEWDSLALGFTVERSSDAGSNWTTLVTNEESVDLGSGTAGRYRYEDDTVANTVTYRYRVTAFIGSAMSASATSADVTVNNGSSPVAQDDFESYVPASNLGSASSAANWEAINDNVVVYNPLLVGPASVYGGGAGGTTTSMAKSTATFSANHRSEATAVTLSAGSFSFAALGVRCQSGAATFYAFLVDGSNWYVMDFIAAVQHVITNGTSTVSDGDLFAIEASGAGSSTRLKIQKFHSGSWTDIATNIDPGTSHYIDNGAPGVGGSSANATFGRVDDWKGFDL